jgi:DDE superfamily endonuclease
VNWLARILFLSDTMEGTIHDKRLADLTPYPLPAGSELVQDLGFLGFSLDGVSITMPHKRPKGGELTPDQKAENRQIARRRVRIEHIISSIERCAIVTRPIRLRADDIRDVVMEICCALHNLRVRLSPWQPLT